MMALRAKMRGMMAKRKVTYKQLNIRMPSDLHKQITAEAKENGWPVNRELVRRLERSFVDDSVEALIKATSTDVGLRVLESITQQLNRVYQLLGRPDLVAKVNKGEDGNG
jgi:hypothetical protein